MLCKIDLLDKGYVILEDIMGSDLDITAAARVSYLGTSKGEEADKKLLFYLMKNEHWTPFETAQLRFRVKCPLPVARQWFRHRAFHFNEVSRRYTEEDLSFFIPDELRFQDSKNKQSSYTKEEYESKEISKQLLELYADYIKKALGLYYQMITAGVGREQARLILPQSMYTEFVFVADLRNLLHFCRLRSDPHAQYEIRVYSDAILEMIKDKFPWTYEAYSGTS